MSNFFLENTNEGGGGVLFLLSMSLVSISQPYQFL
jgi:hypothetical protein